MLKKSFSLIFVSFLLFSCSPSTSEPTVQFDDQRVQEAKNIENSLKNTYGMTNSYFFKENNDIFIELSSQSNTYIRSNLRQDLDYSYNIEFSYVVPVNEIHNKTIVFITEDSSKDSMRLFKGFWLLDDKNENRKVVYSVENNEYILEDYNYTYSKLTNEGEGNTGPTLYIFRYKDFEKNWESEKSLIETHNLEIKITLEVFGNGIPNDYKINSDLFITGPENQIISSTEDIHLNTIVFSFNFSLESTGNYNFTYFYYSNYNSVLVRNFTSLTITQ